jgi:hypothetical protein
VAARFTTSSCPVNHPLPSEFNFHIFLVYRSLFNLFIHCDIYLRMIEKVSNVFLLFRIFHYCSCHPPACGNTPHSALSMSSLVNIHAVIQCILLSISQFWILEIYLNSLAMTFVFINGLAIHLHPFAEILQSNNISCYFPIILNHILVISLLLIIIPIVFGRDKWPLYSSLFFSLWWSIKNPHSWCMFHSGSPWTTMVPFHFITICLPFAMVHKEPL